jgi:hypothetical protein
MAIDIDYKVVADTLSVRAEHYTSSKKIAADLVKNQIITVTEIAKDDRGNTWAKHSGGWTVITLYKDTWLVPVQSRSAPATDTTSTATNADASIATGTEVAQIKTAITNEYNVLSDLTFKMQSARSIMGLPHQFLYTADERVPGSNFGRLFTENILLDMPLVTIIPGGPKFLAGKGITKNDKNSIAQALVDAASKPAEDLGAIIDTVLGGKNARYYSFETQYAEYMKYVNTLNSTTATYLGIQNQSIRTGTKSYGDFNWEIEQMESDSGKGILDLVGAHGAITFYYEKAGTGMSESNSNSTDKSMLEGAINGASNMSKEAEFLFGVGAGKAFDAMNEQKAEQKINTITAGLSGDNGMMKNLWTNLKAGVTTTFAGANMLLPEIWKDSTYSRSFSLDINLVTPYGTPEAFFLNIAVPLNFLLGLSMPRQFGANAFYAPFLIQAFSTGVFNCSLGIIDSISISRFGPGDSISRIGLPLEIRISLTFKDLYGAMAISNADNYGIFMNNTALLDFIANLTAINLNEPDLTRKLNIFLRTKIDKLLNIPGNIKNKIFDSFRDSVVNSLKY